MQYRVADELISPEAEHWWIILPRAKLKNASSTLASAFVVIYVSNDFLIHNLPNDQTDAEIAQNVDTEHEYFEWQYIAFSYCCPGPRTHVVVIVN